MGGRVNKIVMTSVVVATRDQVSSDLGGEAVILHLGNGVYYSLNGSGSRIWSLIQQPSIVEGVYTTLLAEYEVEPRVCERELLRLLETLNAQGLIETLDAVPA